MLGKRGLGSWCHGLFKLGTSLRLGPRDRLWEKTHLGAAPSRKTQGGSTFHHVKSFSRKTGFSSSLPTLAASNSPICPYEGRGAKTVSTPHPIPGPRLSPWPVLRIQGDVARYIQGPGLLGTSPLPRTANHGDTCPEHRGGKSLGQT